MQGCSARAQPSIGGSTFVPEGGDCWRRVNPGLISWWGPVVYATPAICPVRGCRQRSALARRLARPCVDGRRLPARGVHRPSRRAGLTCRPIAPRIGDRTKLLHRCNAAVSFLVAARRPASFPTRNTGPRPKTNQASLTTVAARVGLGLRACESHPVPAKPGSGGERSRVQPRTWHRASPPPGLDEAARGGKPCKSAARQLHSGGAFCNVALGCSP